MSTRSSLEQTVRAIAWIAASAVLGLLLLAPAVVVGAWIAGLVDSVHIVRLGSAAGIWTFLATWLTVGLARAFSVERASLDLRLIAVVATAGGISSAVAEAGLIAWTIGKFGRWDPEYIGLSLLIPVFLTIAASSLSGAMVTAGLARKVAAAGAGVALIGIGLEVLLNLRGLADGVSASGPALAVSLAASAGFALLGTYLLRRVRRRSAG